VRQAVRALPSDARQELERQVGELPVETFSRGTKEEKRGKIFLLPGIMGSDLFARTDRTRERIWLDTFRLVAGGFRRLKVGDGGETISPGGPHRLYLPMIMAVDEQWMVVPVGYDWRLPLAEAAELLADQIRTAGGGQPGPAHLVAHSMGGLVARMLIVSHSDVWDALDDPPNRTKGGRLIMMGTPNMGSFAIVRALTGDEALVRLLAFATWGSLRDVREVLATFPGAYQLITAPDAEVAVGESQHAELWKLDSWEPDSVRSALLEQAQESHRQLRDAGFDRERMYYVAGSGHDTPAGVHISAPGRFQYRMTREGAGRVPHARGIPSDDHGRPSIGAWYSEAEHGDLPKEPRVIRAVLDLLDRGDTDALPTSPPVRSRGVPLTGTNWIPSELIDPVELDPVTEQVLRSPAVARTQRRAAADTLVDRAVAGWLGSRPVAKPTLPTLRLSVLHASLEHSTYPVLVGHYRGDPIAGAEGHLDSKIGGQLSQRQLLDSYPREIGEVHRFVTEGGRPVGGLVIGLGTSGELTPTALASAVRDAALEHAVRWLEQPDPRMVVEDCAIGLSSVIIGSYGNAGLTLPTSVAAVVEGVLLANGLLTERRLADRVQIGALEIAERYAAPAEAAVQVIRDIEHYLPAALRATVALQPDPFLQLGEGRRPAVHTNDYGAGLWHRLIVTSDEIDADGRMKLHFTSLGSRARADQLVQNVNVRQVTEMLRQAVTQATADDSVNIALFEMLLPNVIKRELAAVDNVQFVLDPPAADFPWEALVDRGGLTGAGPLSRRAGLLRQLRLESAPVRLDPPSGADFALVIGDPPTGDERFPPLDAARREAEEVAGLLQAHMSVQRRIFPEDADATQSASKVLTALLANDYRIIHISGHGYFERRKKPRKPLGGVVIGKRSYLTADDIRNLRRPPDIVFLNCCHLASVAGAVIDESPTTTPIPTAFSRRHVYELAASLSAELMDMGVKAVVAAGWSVADRPAAVLARAFYERMLDGQMFGDAVKAARDAAFQADNGASNTWAAYQCYGDPGFRLVSEARRRTRRTEPVSAEDLVRRLEDIQVSAGDAAPPLAEELTAQVSALQALAEREWSDRARVWSALGEAYGALAQTEAAVLCYRTALNCPNSELPIRAVEQLAVQEYKLAMALRQKGEERASSLPDRATEPELRDKAKERLDTLDQLGPTAERHALRAAWYKRQAVTLTAPEERADRLAAMAESAKEYVAAWTQSSAEPPERGADGADDDGTGHGDQGNNVPTAYRTVETGRCLARCSVSGNRWPCSASA
jgi:CHAT domain-containing protein